MDLKEHEFQVVRHVHRYQLNRKILAKTYSNATSCAVFPVPSIPSGVSIHCPIVGWNAGVEECLNTGNDVRAVWDDKPMSQIPNVCLKASDIG